MRLSLPQAPTETSPEAWTRFGPSRTDQCTPRSRVAQRGSPQVDFWNGVPGARAALGADATSTNGETLAALAPVEEPWKEEGWDAYLVTSGDKRMLNDTVTSAALTAALLGAPFDVVKWAEAVSQRLQRNEHNRSLLNGLAGPLMVCNALGSSGGHQVADLAERLVESMRANECRDKDWTFLQGRAGTAITLSRRNPSDRRPGRRS